MSKFEVYRDDAGEFRFRLKADNGETVAASEGYGTRAGAHTGAEAVKAAAASAGIEDVDS